MGDPVQLKSQGFILDKPELIHRNSVQVPEIAVIRSSANGLCAYKNNFGFHSAKSGYVAVATGFAQFGTAVFRECLHVQTAVYVHRQFIFVICLPFGIPSFFRKTIRHRFLYNPFHN